jgi:hypothetical protein
MEITDTKPYKVILSSDEEFYDLEESHFGLCIACGEENYNCEPDASSYICEMCGERKVEGLANLLMMGRVDLI